VSYAVKGPRNRQTVEVKGAWPRSRSDQGPALRGLFLCSVRGRQLRRAAGRV